MRVRNQLGLYSQRPPAPFEETTSTYGAVCRTMNQRHGPFDGVPVGSQNPSSNDCLHGHGCAFHERVVCESAQCLQDANATHHHRVVSIAHDPVGVLREDCTRLGFRHALFSQVH